MLRPKREEAEAYLRQRQVQGCNAVTFVLFTPGHPDISEKVSNAYGDEPFALQQGRSDFTRLLITPGLIRPAQSCCSF